MKFFQKKHVSSFFVFFHQLTVFKHSVGYIHLFRVMFLRKNRNIVTYWVSLYPSSFEISTIFEKFSKEIRSVLDLVSI